MFYFMHKSIVLIILIVFYKLVSNIIGFENIAIILLLNILVNQILDKED